jgi:hypothetical protein
MKWFEVVKGCCFLLGMLILTIVVMAVGLLALIEVLDRCDNERIKDARRPAR